MRKWRRRQFSLNAGSSNEDICEALCKELNNKEINFGNDIQITVSKEEDTTDVKIDYFETLYTPECKFNYDDCIHDPAYRRYYDGEEVGCCDDCEDGCWYDDEDK